MIGSSVRLDSTPRGEFFLTPDNESMWLLNGLTESLSFVEINLSSCLTTKFIEIRRCLQAGQQ